VEIKVNINYMKKDIFMNTFMSLLMSGIFTFLVVGLLFGNPADIVQGNIITACVSGAFSAFVSSMVLYKKYFKK